MKPEERRERMKAVVTRLQHYMATYDAQDGYEAYTDVTFIDDVLYGLGLALDPVKHAYGNGYDVFKEEALLPHLTPEGYAVVPVNDDQARYRADISGNDFLNTAFNNGGRPVAIDLFDIMIEAMLKAAEGERTLEESGLRKG